MWLSRAERMSRRRKGIEKTARMYTRGLEHEAGVRSGRWKYGVWGNGGLRMWQKINREK